MAETSLEYLFLVFAQSKLFLARVQAIGGVAPLCPEIFQQRFRINGNVYVNGPHFSGHIGMFQVVLLSMVDQALAAIALFLGI